MHTKIVRVTLQGGLLGLSRNLEQMTIAGVPPFQENRED